MKVPQTVFVDGPCPLCHRADTAGPFTCKRCGVDVCKDCHEISSLGLDKDRRRILCKTCVDAVEAQEALDALAKDNAPKPDDDPFAPFDPAAAKQKQQDYEKKLRDLMGRQTPWRTQYRDDAQW